MAKGSRPAAPSYTSRVVSPELTRRHPITGVPEPSTKPLQEQIAKLEKEVSDLNALIGLYDEESRKDQNGRKELERELTNVRVQLELLEKKRDRFVRVDQFLVELAAIEKDRDFAAELGVCGPAFTLSSLIDKIISGKSEEAWKAIDAFRARVRELSQTMTSLLESQKQEPAVIATKQLPVETVVDEQVIKQRVDDVLENRVRTLVRDLYEQALALPDRIRKTYSSFSEDRAKFQDVLHARKRLTDDLMQVHRLDAKFSILRDSIQRYLPLSKPEDVAELESLIRLARSSLERLNELDAEATAIATRIEEHKAQYLETNKVASGLWDRAASIKGYCSLFALPYPTEVDRQVDHAKQQLSFVNPRSEESARITNMSMYQTVFPERPKALKDFLAIALPLAEALLLKVRRVNPEDLFRDKPSRKDAFSRLFLIASDVCNNTTSNRFKGYKGRKTLVESVLRSGLIDPRDAEDFAECSELAKQLFDLEQYKWSWLWKPKQQTLELARRFLHTDCFQPDAVRAAILDGQALYKETQKANRKAQAKNSDKEEPDPDDEEL